MTVGTCPACGSPYASGAQTCAKCGEPLTSVARILSAPAAPRQPRWLQQNRQRAPDLRKVEDKASAERLGALLEVDRRRLEAERAEAARTRVRERRVVILAAVLFALIAALALGVVLAIVL
ncbi:MAG TPA: zinc ribbon domain-containing protein [Anaerolineales bacterium]|nr:zinc ribbon domain-containing protein [Anaerolineales bacterium]